MAPKGERREKMLADVARFFGDQVALWEAQEAVDVFNSRLSAGTHVWSYPTIGAALLTKHHWLIVACDSCGLALDLDLRMKPRHPETSVRAALKDVRCRDAMVMGGRGLCGLINVRVLTKLSNSF